jgi:hypothetical protein
MSEREVFVAMLNRLHQKQQDAIADWEAKVASKRIVPVTKERTVEVLASGMVAEYHRRKGISPPPPRKYVVTETTYYPPKPTFDNPGFMEGEGYVRVGYTQYNFDEDGNLEEIEEQGYDS